MRPALILVPGLMCDQTVWEPQKAALGPLFDIRIAENGARISLASMAEAIIRQAPPRFALAGHSMGARVALEVIRRIPERVTALALLDTGYRPLAAGEAGEREKVGRFALLDQARREGMRAMGRTWLEGMVFPARVTDRALTEPILDMIERKPLALFEAQTQALLARPDATDLLARIRCPTLVLCGREDAWSPVQRHRQMCSLIAGSRLQVVPDCGHMSTLERPAAVSDALRGWLEPVASARGA